MVRTTRIPLYSHCYDLFRSLYQQLSALQISYLICNIQTVLECVLSCNQLIVKKKEKQTIIIVNKQNKPSYLKIYAILPPNEYIVYFSFF